MRRVFKIAAVFSAVILAALFVNLTAASAATGGGCDGGPSNHSFRACVSYSSGSFKPDGYATQAIKGGCSLHLALVNALNGRVVVAANYPCVAGHVGPIFYVAPHGSYYATLQYIVSCSAHCAFPFSSSPPQSTSGPAANLITGGR